MKKTDELTEIEIELENRLTSKGLIRYAWDYFKSFEILQKEIPKEIEKYEVKYYLLCHSIELGMKAYLREKGYSRKQLLKLGHDLEKIIGQLHKEGVVIDIDSINRTFILNDYYNKKMFEYPQTGYKSMPSLKHMEDYVKLLLDMVSNSIYKLLP